MAAKRRHRRRYNEPGQAHELTFSCYHGHKFLQAERTCEWLRDALTKARADLEFDLWAHVFIPEHAHLIVFPRRKIYDIADILEAIKQPVARKALAYIRKHAPEWLPRITVQSGDRIRHHYWQEGGGFDRNVIKPRTLLKMIDYIHLNPVRRWLVERAIDWKWSSAAWFEGGESPVPLDPIPPEWLIE
jgi:putative transposase